MKTQLSLADKRIVLTGTWSTLTQMLVNQLAQMGASIGLVTHAEPSPQRFLEQINNDRSGNEQLGRAFHVPCDYEDLAAVQDSVSRVAESLGAIDGLVHTHCHFANMTHIAEFTQLVQKNTVTDLQNLSVLVQACLPYFQHRGRGRFVFITDEFMNYADSAMSSSMYQGSVEALTKSLSRQSTKNSQITANALELFPSEEFVNFHFSGTASSSLSIVDKMKLFKETYPDARGTASERVAELVAVLLQNQSRTINGQIFKV